MKTLLLKASLAETTVTRHLMTDSPSLLAIILERVAFTLSPFLFLMLHVRGQADDAGRPVRTQLCLYTDILVVFDH